MSICPVILCGGSGTRLWPLSRKNHPKQLLSLFGDKSLLQDTVLRVSDPAHFSAPILVCNDEYRFMVAEQLRQIGITPRAIVLEPEGRNTAAPAAIAAMLLQQDGGDESMLILPSDHAVTDQNAFLGVIDAADTAARQYKRIMTLGIVPDRPHTGYGYIKAAASLADDTPARLVDAFVEKPTVEKAQAYLDDGSHFWNSGMFLSLPDVMMAEMDAHAPDTAGACRTALAGQYQDLDFVRLDADAFGTAPSISIDYAVAEKSDRLGVVPANMGWSDAGSWESLWDLAEKDIYNNALSGDVISRNTYNSLVRSDGPIIAVNGLENVVVTASKDAVLVSSRDSAQDVGDLVKQLSGAGIEETDNAARQYRPWGWFETMDGGDGFKVKRIAVNPGGKLSLQAHGRRAEHWIVVQGTATVTRDEDVFDLQANQSTYIAIGQRHRLENRQEDKLQMIEVQTGDYLEEDDITRFDDDYGR